MKKTFILLSALLTFHVIQAQSEYSYQYDPDVRRTLANPADPWLNEVYSPPANVRQIEFIYTSKNSSSSSIYKYNQYDKLVELISKNKKGELHKKVLLQYDDKQLLNKVDFYKKNKLDYSVLYEYNSNSKIISLIYMDASGKIKNKYLWEYNANDCLSRSITYKGESNTASHTWEYQYLDSFKKSIVIHRNKKGKIKEQWSFMCDETGKKEKKMQTVCVTMEPVNDFIIITNEGTDKNGKTFRHVGKFTLKDTLPLEWKSYNHRNELVRETMYDKNYEIMLSGKLFKNGKLQFENHYKYQNGILIERKFIQKGKEKSRTTFIYDSANRLTGTRTFYNNKFRRSLKIVYS